MKKFLFSLGIGLIGIFLFSQDYTMDNFNEDYGGLINFVKAEDWQNAYNSSVEIKNKISTDSSEFDVQNKLLNYVLIFSTAGLLNEKKLSKEQALQQVEALKGSVMIMPFHPFDMNCYVNCTRISDLNRNTFFTGVNNDAGTQIFSFEYVTIDGGIKESPKELTDKWISLMGTLDKISVEGNMFPRFELHFSQGKYIVAEE